MTGVELIKYEAAKGQVPEYGDLVAADGRTFLINEDPYDYATGCIRSMAFEVDDHQRLVRDEEGRVKSVFIDIVEKR